MALPTNEFSSAITRGNAPDCASPIQVGRTVYVWNNLTKVQMFIGVHKYFVGDIFKPYLRVKKNAHSLERSNLDHSLPWSMVCFECTDINIDVYCLNGNLLGVYIIDLKYSPSITIQSKWCCDLYIIWRNVQYFDRTCTFTVPFDQELI